MITDHSIARRGDRTQKHEETESGSPIDDAVRGFIELTNHVYSDKEWTPLTQSDIEAGTCTGDIGRAGQVDDEIVFEHDPEWWRRAKAGDRIGLICHEVGHLDYPHHKPSFWEQVTENYYVSRELESNLENIVGEFNWGQVEEFLVNDPTTKTVDNRFEIAFERRKKIAEKIEYDGKVSPFDNMRILVRHPRDTSQRVPIYELNWSEKSVDDIIDYFHRHRRGKSRDGLNKDNGKYFISPLPVNKSDDGYEVVERHELATLVDILGNNRVSVNIVE